MTRKDSGRMAERKEGEVREDEARKDRRDVWRGKRVEG